jgi:hypothetical protein
MCQGYYGHLSEGSSVATAWAARQRTGDCQSRLGDFSMASMRFNNPVSTIGRGTVDGGEPVLLQNVEEEEEGGISSTLNDKDNVSEITFAPPIREQPVVIRW